MKFKKLSADAFKQIQMNAGVLLSNFNPTSATFQDEDIICATSGGLQATATPTFTDFGEDIDNCPKNTKELKKLESWEITASGTGITITPKTAKEFAGLADIANEKVTLRNDVDLNDFHDIWIVADYSEYNGKQKGGFCAFHLINALSTGGFSIQTTDNGKGQFAFTYTAHYSLDDPDTVPFEIYVKEGTAEE